MNEEIKEILELQIDCDYKRLSVDEIITLKDYITNLQEENKELGRYYTRANNEFLELNKRIKKATKYIKEHAWFCYKDNEEVLDRVGINNLLNILNGGEDNE